MSDDESPGCETKLKRKKRQKSCFDGQEMWNGQEVCRLGLQKNEVDNETREADEES